MLPHGLAGKALLSKSRVIIRRGGRLLLLGPVNPRPSGGPEFPRAGSDEHTRTTDAAERALVLADNRYKGGLTSYLEVVVAQSAALASVRAILPPMPLYEYRCRDCGKAFEQFVSGTAPPACPACEGENLQKLLSVFAVSSSGGSRESAPDSPSGGCGSCGDPRGPGACSMD